VGRSPNNLAITIFLYIVGILLVMMAIVLLLQAVGAFTKVPPEVMRSIIVALVLLSIGSGILAGIRSR